MDAENIAYQFFDVRKDGVSESQITDWVKAVGWEKLLNKRGTTWRGLDDVTKDGVDEAKAIALMAAHPALIKRPVFVRSGEIIVGFSLAEQALLQVKPV